jgi:hypothetical protein
MCDGILNEKLRIIGEMIELEEPFESREYLQMHLTGTTDELKIYRDKLASSMRPKKASFKQIS